MKKRYPDKASFVAQTAARPEKCDADPEVLEKTFTLDDIGKALMSGGKDQSVPGSFNARRFNDGLLAQSKSKIVSSSEGRIATMMLTPPSHYEEGGRYFIEKEERHFKTLIQRLGDNRHYVMLCHPELQETIDKEWFKGLKNVTREFATSPRFEYSIWAQDAYVVLNAEDGQSILVEGVLFNRSEDMTVADDVSAQTDIASMQSSLYFEGGNILAGDELTLIGDDYFYKNETRYGMETYAEVREAFRKLFGTKMLEIGGPHSFDWHYFDMGVLSGFGYQPLFHIDMYVTRTGVIGKSGKEIVMYGRPAKTKEIIGRYTEEDECDGEVIDSYFSETREQLEEYFEVYDLPLLLTKGRLNDPNETEDYFYWLSFNNVVIESDGDDRTVYMSTYSEDAKEYATDKKLREDLEDAAADIWKSAAGFDVKRMDGLEDLAYADGSVHCMTKVLKRKRSG